MAETYSHSKVTVDEVGGCAVAITASGVTTTENVAQSTTYNFVRLTVDRANNILSGYKSNGDLVIFETGVDLSVTLINALVTASSSSYGAV